LRKFPPFYTARSAAANPGARVAGHDSGVTGQ
jgi:hypothetical protein